MFHQIYYHLVWTTRGRRALITRDIAVFLDRTLRALARQERARVIELGMVTTHVHLLLRAHPMTMIPRLVQRLKGTTAALAGRELGLPAEQQLRWAPGYTIQTVSPRMVRPRADSLACTLVSMTSAPPRLSHRSGARGIHCIPTPTAHVARERTRGGAVTA